MYIFLYIESSSLAGCYRWWYVYVSLPKIYSRWVLNLLLTIVQLTLSREGESRYCFCSYGDFELWGFLLAVKVLFWKWSKLFASNSAWSELPYLNFFEYEMLNFPLFFSNPLQISLNSISQQKKLNNHQIVDGMHLTKW